MPRLVINQAAIQTERFRRTCVQSSRFFHKNFDKIYCSTKTMIEMTPKTGEMNLRRSIISRVDCPSKSPGYLSGWKDSGTAEKICVTSSIGVPNSQLSRRKQRWYFFTWQVSAHQSLHMQKKDKCSWGRRSNRSDGKILAIKLNTWMIHKKIVGIYTQYVGWRQTPSHSPPETRILSSNIGLFGFVDIEP